MTLDYRAALLVNAPPELDELRRLIEEEPGFGNAEISLSTAHVADVGRAARAVAEAAGDRLVVDVFDIPGRCAVLIERHVADLTAREARKARPAPELVSTGRLGVVPAPSAGAAVGTDEVLASLQEHGIVVAVVADDAFSSKTTTALFEYLAGMAPQHVVSSETAMQLREVAGATGNIRPGAVLVLAHTAQGASRLEIVPATAVAANLTGVARRVAGRALDSARRRALTAQHQHLRAALDRPGAEEAEGLFVEALAAEQRRAELEKDLQQVLDERDLAFLEQDEALSELERARSRVRFLEEALRRLGDVAWYAEEDEDETAQLDVQSCRDAVAYAQQLLPYLTVTARLEEARELDGHQKSNIWARKIWAALRALNDYAKSKADGRHRGDLHSYSTDPPEAALPLTPHQLAMRESEATEASRELTRVRTFPVPPAVDVREEAYMGAHVKIERGGYPAPRMHFLDDTSGPTGTVIVGYVGHHLPTSSG